MSRRSIKVYGRYRPAIAERIRDVYPNRIGILSDAASLSTSAARKFADAILQMCDEIEEEE